MKPALALLFALLLITLRCSAQTAEPHPVDRKPCDDLMAELKARVDKFGGDHPDYSVDVTCGYRGDPNAKKLPERHIPLTKSEVETHSALRKTETAAFEAMGKYEDYLLRAHHIRKPEFTDPCYYFVGFVLDTNYITVDPNPMTSECR